MFRRFSGPDRGLTAAEYLLKNLQHVEEGKPLQDPRKFVKMMGELVEAWADASRSLQHRREFPYREGAPGPGLPVEEGWRPAYIRVSSEYQVLRDNPAPILTRLEVTDQHGHRLSTALQLLAEGYQHLDRDALAKPRDPNEIYGLSGEGPDKARGALDQLLATRQGGGHKHGR